jgi:hypothetical protein
MTQPNTPVSEGSPDEAAREGTRVSGAQAHNSNGTAAGHAEPAANGEPAAAAPTPGNRMERAEILADQLARRVAAATAIVGRGFFRFTARLREEAEDVWAEAQNLRKKDKS